MIHSKIRIFREEMYLRVRAPLLLSDDPGRLFLVQAALARDGRARDFLLLRHTVLELLSRLFPVSTQ